MKNNLSYLLQKWCLIWHKWLRCGVLLRGVILVAAGGMIGQVVAAQELLLSAETALQSQKVYRGEVFSLKIVLTAADDLIVLAYINKEYLMPLEVSRGDGEVFFSFKAQREGKTELIFDKLSEVLQENYIHYNIEITPPLVQPAAEDAPITAAVAAEREQDAVERAVAVLINGFIVSKDLAAAEGAFLRYIDELSLDYPYRLDVIIELAQLYAEQGAGEKAYTLITTELTTNAGAFTKAQERRLLFSKGYLQRLLGRYEDAFVTWLALKRELNTRAVRRTAATQQWGRVLVELGETLFVMEQYGAAEREYRLYERFYDTATVPAARLEYFLILYRLANIYELDAKLRDYRKAYDYYVRARKLYESFLAAAEATGTTYYSEYERTRARIQFIADHFINVR